MIQKPPLDAETRRRRLDDYEQTCRRRGLPFTVQRRLILETVLDLGTHPTCDEIHAAVAARQAGVSRATVYRNLESMVEMGIVTKASHPGSSARFDGRTERHHHLVCVRCDRMIDISDERLDALPVPDTTALGFSVSELSVQLRGVCRQCREEEKT